MLLAGRPLIPARVFFLFLAMAAVAGMARADTIGPAQEQEFADAKGALDAARKAQAEKYAPAEFKRAQENLQAADSARQARDAARLSESSRIARARAELATALAELGVETDKLAATNAALQKAKDEIERLAKPK